MSEKEIELLREELLQCYSEIAQYSCVLFSVVAALLAFAVNSDNYLLCLLPYIVLFPILFMCETKQEGICRTGAYLSVFAGDNFKWERRVHSLDNEKWRPLIGKKKRKSHNSIIVKLGLKRDRMHYHYYLISMLSSAAAIYKISNYGGYSSKGIIIRVLSIIIATIIALIIIRKSIVFVPEVRRYYIIGWNKIKEKEDSSQQN